MAESNDRFKKAPARKKEPVRRVTLSPEEQQAYADLAQKRADRERDYGRHLAPNERVK